MKILITTTSFAKFDKTPLDMLKERGLDVALNPFKQTLNKEQAMHLYCRDLDAVIAGTEIINRDVLKNAAGLKVISRCGTGTENIDVVFAKKKKIKIFNTPDVPTLAVAELCMGFIFNLLRKVNCMDIAMKNGKWEKITGDLLSNKKIGIIGFGRIGRKFAEFLRAFNCKTAYSDPFVEDGAMGLKRLTKRELLKWADIVSVHVSSKEMVLGHREFNIMKKGSWLINTSRGEVIDEDALYAALKEGHLSGAAIDVFRREPYRGRFTKLNNVILTPHIGSYAKETRIEMEIQAVKNLLKGLGDTK